MNRFSPLVLPTTILAALACLASAHAGQIGSPAPDACATYRANLIGRLAGARQAMQDLEQDVYARNERVLRNNGRIRAVQAEIREVESIHGELAELAPYGPEADHRQASLNSPRPDPGPARLSEADLALKAQCDRYTGAARMARQLTSSCARLEARLGWQADFNRWGDRRNRLPEHSRAEIYQTDLQQLNSLRHDSQRLHVQLAELVTHGKDIERKRAPVLVQLDTRRNELRFVEREQSEYRREGCPGPEKLARQLARFSGAVTLDSAGQLVPDPAAYRHFLPRTFEEQAAELPRTPEPPKFSELLVHPAR
jgi:hypothetical protein